jgi:hypothetical protein
MCQIFKIGLRKLRDSTLAKSSSSSAPIHRAIRKLLPKSGNFKKQLDLQSEQYRQACSEYALNSSKVIRALGLSVAQFNQIGRQVSSDPVLKEKVRAAKGSLHILILYSLFIFYHIITYSSLNILYLLYI